MTEQQDHSPSERQERLWWLAAAPSIWALHFLSCYITVAIWCAKAVEREETIDPVRWVALVYTVVALAGIAAVGHRAFKRHSFGTATIPHDFDTPEDRHRFLGFAGLLLSVMSALAVVYTALPFGFLATCH